MLGASTMKKNKEDNLQVLHRNTLKQDEKWLFLVEHQGRKSSLESTDQFHHVYVIEGRLLRMVGDYGEATAC